MRIEREPTAVIIGLHQFVAVIPVIVGLKGTGVGMTVRCECLKSAGASAIIRLGITSP